MKVAALLVRSPSFREGQMAFFAFLRKGSIFRGHSKGEPGLCTKLPESRIFRIELAENVQHDYEVIRTARRDGAR